MNNEDLYNNIINNNKIESLNDEFINNNYTLGMVFINTLISYI